MANNYTVVETSKIAAVRGGGHIYSCIATFDVQNGSVGYIGDRVTTADGHECYTFNKFTTATLGNKKAVLVANPEWNYDESLHVNQARYNFINAANTPFRAYEITEDDLFAVSVEGLDATGVTSLAVGQLVAPVNNKMTLKAYASDTALGDVAFQGVIEQIMARGLGWTTSGGTTYGRPASMYLIRVKQNGNAIVAATAPMSLEATAVSCTIGGTVDVDIYNASGTARFISSEAKLTGAIADGTLTITAASNITAGTYNVFVADDHNTIAIAVTVAAAA